MSIKQLTSATDIVIEVGHLACHWVVITVIDYIRIKQIIAESHAIAIAFIVAIITGYFKVIWLAYLNKYLSGRLFSGHYRIIVDT